MIGGLGLAIVVVVVYLMMSGGDSSGPISVPSYTNKQVEGYAIVANDTGDIWLSPSLTNVDWKISKSGAAKQVLQLQDGTFAIVNKDDLYVYLTPSLNSGTFVRSDSNNVKQLIEYF